MKLHCVGSVVPHLKGIFAGGIGINGKGLRRVMTGNVLFLLDSVITLLTGSLVLYRDNRSNTGVLSQMRLDCAPFSHAMSQRGIPRGLSIDNKDLRQAVTRDDPLHLCV